VPGRLGHGGSGTTTLRRHRRSDANRFTADDLVAVTFLSVDIPRIRRRELLRDRTDEFTRLLVALGPDRDLVDERDPLHDSWPGWDLMHALRGLPGVRTTIASKLQARKCPQLRPIWDLVVAAVTGKAQWEPRRAALCADGAVGAYVCRSGCPRRFGRGVHDRRCGRGDPHAAVVPEDAARRGLDRWVARAGRGHLRGGSDRVRVGQSTRRGRDQVCGRGAVEARAPARGQGQDRPRRDAERPAGLLRIGELPGVRVPTETEEAARDLVRAREDTRGDSMRARHRLSTLLLRHGLAWDQSAWTGAHDAWLRSLRFDRTGVRLAFDEAYETVLVTHARPDRLGRAIETMAAEPISAPTVGRLCCLRGVATLTAFGLTVEIGDWRRFTGSTIGSYLGLVYISLTARRPRHASSTGPHRPKPGSDQSRCPHITTTYPCPLDRSDPHISCAGHARAAPGQAELCSGMRLASH
jgi:hypothetical protein